MGAPFDTEAVSDAIIKTRWFRGFIDVESFVEEGARCGRTCADRDGDDELMRGLFGLDAEDKTGGVITWGSQSTNSKSMASQA